MGNRKYLHLLKKFLNKLHLSSDSVFFRTMKKSLRGWLRLLVVVLVYFLVTSRPSVQPLAATCSVESSISEELTTRYRNLPNHTYFIALNLYNSQLVFPTIMQALIAFTRVVGTDRVFISIYENGSTDSTGLLLQEFDRLVSGLGIAHVISTNTAKSDFKHHNRIALLAEYRNRALAPLFDWEKKADKILFLND